MVAVGRGAHPGRGVRQAEPPRCDYDPDEHPGLPGLPRSVPIRSNCCCGLRWPRLALNRQPWAFVVVDDRELLRELAGALPFAKMAARAPLAVVVCGDLSRNPGASGDWWVMDASAASEKPAPCGPCPWGWGAVWTGVYPRGERVEAVRRVLGLPSDVVPLNLIPVGYPADNPEPKQKWNPANVRHNGWTE